MHFSQSEDTTRGRILASAANLFAEKGFTETTIREIADSLGLNVASLYYHFPSKTAILEQMLEDYSAGNIKVYDEQTITDILSEDSTIDGILRCLQTSFPKDRVNYFLKVLCVMFQEQLRNPIVGDYMSNHIILRSEQKVRTIIEVLKRLGVVSHDTDPDYWMKVTSSLSYSFAVRMMLGIGDNTPEYTGRRMAEMHRSTFELLLAVSGTGTREGGA